MIKRNRDIISTENAREPHESASEGNDMLNIEPMDRKDIGKAVPGVIASGDNLLTVSTVSEMIGHACRDCINIDFDVLLDRNDCKYEMADNGHRKIGVCKYCGRSRPIVMGLKIGGRLKCRGK